MPAPRSIPSRPRRSRGGAALLGAALLLAAGPSPLPAALPNLQPQIESDALAVTWARDLEAALQVGLAEYKPVLALLSLPNCGWCSRLKNELADPSLRPLLASFVLVEVDADTSDLARLHGIRSVPTVLILSGDGRVRGGFSGFQPAPELKETLAREINFNPADSESAALAEERFARLVAGSPANDDWPGLLRDLGEPARREAIRQAILDLPAWPAAALVPLLDSPDLAVRIGALELLEERTGEAFGFDPWLPPSDSDAAALRQPWLDWLANSTNAPGKDVYAPLTDARIAAYIQDILGDDRARSARAMQMLEAGGHHAALQLAAFIQAHPDLAPGLRRRLREVQYAILLHGTPGHQASATAHQLVFGNLDSRIRTVAALPKTGAGVRAIPILQDLLADDNPLLREAAAEAILDITGGAGTVLLQPFLRSETDVNVLYSTLRALARTKSPRAVVALRPFLTHDNEDLVIVTLEGLAKLQYSALAKPLAQRLRDPRWRVRVAALEAIAELKTSALRDDVAEAIHDPDPFVRHAAIGALAAISSPKAFAGGAARLFQSLPELRPQILQAMARHDLDIPNAFIDAIAADTHPERIVACLGAAADLEKRALPLALRLAAHPNPDVSAAALAILLKSGVTHPAGRGHILNALRSRTGDDLASLLDDLRISSSDFQPFAHQFRHWIDPEQKLPAAPPSGRPPEALINLFEAFGQVFSSPPGETESFPELPPPSAHPDAPSLDDLVAAFENAAASPASDGPAANPATFPDLIREIETLAAHSHPRVDFLASLRLVALGHSRLAQSLVDRLPEASESERRQIANALSSISTPAARAANIALLADSAEMIRYQAAGNLIDNFSADGFADLVDELLRPGSPLRASDISFGYRTRNLPASTLQRQGRRLIDSDAPRLQALGILLAVSTAQDRILGSIDPFLQSDNPYVRAAALRALALRDPTRFEQALPDALRHPSPVVRSAIAQAFISSSSSEEISISPDESVSLTLQTDRRSRAAPLAPPVRDALRALAGDPHPPVRFRALLALLSRGETIDVSRLAAALDALPDAQRGARDVFNVFPTYGDSKPRPELRALGTSLRRHLAESSWYRERIDKLCGPPMSEEELLTVNILTRFDPPSAPALLALELPDPDADAATNPPPVLLYFYQPGCKECRDVETLLESMPRYFDSLQIQSHNIRRRDAALLNEALCDRFGVPGNARLIAPSLFAADGALVGSAITFDALADLISRSASREDGRWHAPEQPLLELAEKSIQRRYTDTVKIGVIALIALADGVNPCAFATIIFLLSYLHIARRDPRQLRQVGAAFILGVFLAYFAMGLGLVTLLDRLAFLGGIARIINLAMAAFVLLLALLNFRDGVLCLRGRLGDMTLQLPAVFKDRIHAVIRQGARHRRFLAAAFLIGMVIAVIELPCTGQAYLPTIAYMVRDADLRLHAIGHLLLYNLFFILPLIVIFVLASFGLTHQRLAELLQRHAAAVKFATAALFLALFAVFLAAL